MKEELINQWQLYNDVVERYVEETQTYTRRKELLTFRKFMVWLESGHLDNGFK